jgi:hypothetical protein
MTLENPEQSEELIDLVKKVVRGRMGHVRPPGSNLTLCKHPSGRDECVDVAVVDEHRFAFHYWMRHMQEAKYRTQPECGDSETMSDAPLLISLDWHNDVGCEGDYSEGELEALDPSNPNELALFSWLGLPANNDGHILPAVYLDAISDVHVVTEHQARSPFSISDRSKKPHKVNYHVSIENLLDKLREEDKRRIVLDIDLDFFAIYERDQFKSLVPDDQIEEVLSPRGEFMRTVLPRLCAMTIALEPKYCGGFSNSFHILDILNRVLFGGTLGSEPCTWSDAAKRAAALPES